MKNQLRNSFYTFLCFSIFSVACSKSEDPKTSNSESEQNQQTLEQAYSLLDSGSSTTAANNTTQGTTAEDSALGVPEGASKLLSKLQSFCTPTASGDSADADGDKIKKDATFAFDCNKSLGPLSVAIKGSVHVKDQNDAVKLPKAGFLVDAPNISVAIKLPNGKSLQKTSTTKVELSVSGKERHTSVVRTSSVNAGDKNLKMEIDLDSKSVADDEASPDQSGTTDFKAHIAIKGGEKDKDIVAEAVGLKYSKDCAPKRFKEGTIKITTSDQGSKDIILENCKIKR